MKKSFFTVLIVCLLSSLCGGTRLPACWCAKIVQLCEDFNDDQCILPTVDSAYYLHYVQDTSLDSVAFLFPPVILWSPLEQFKNLLQAPVCCPKCSLTDVTLYSVGWHNAQCERSEPRKIYGACGVTLLIGRVYKCLNGHEVIGYHPGILQHIPQCFIPFLLWHRTGFTCEFIKLVAALIAAGMSLSGIRNFYHKNLLSLYYSRKMQFDQISSSNGLFPALNAWKSSFPSFVPSIHALSGCFLANFWAKDLAYTLRMQSMTIDEGDPWLSLDHTFSSASKLNLIAA